MQKPVSFLTFVVCGSSLSIIAPTSGMPVLAMAAIGNIVTLAYYRNVYVGWGLLCLLNGVVIGMGLCCTFWHGLPLSGEVLFVVMACVICMTLTCITVRFYTRGYQVTERVLNPVLGSLLLSMGLSGLVPELGAMKCTELMSSGSSSNSEVHAWKFFALWAALCFISLPMQYWMMKTPPTPQFEDMAKRLVHPEAGTTVEDVSKKLEDGEIGGRHLILVDAFFLPEDADLSHLTEHERKLVAICRKDEFERDRIMFLGGLA